MALQVLQQGQDAGRCGGEGQGGQAGHLEYYGFTISTAGLRCHEVSQLAINAVVAFSVLEQAWRET